MRSGASIACSTLLLASCQPPAVFPAQHEEIDRRGATCYAALSASPHNFGNTAGGDSLPTTLIVEHRMRDADSNRPYRRAMIVQAGGQRGAIWRDEPGDSVSVWWRDGFGSATLRLVQDSSGLTGVGTADSDEMVEVAANKYERASWSWPVSATVVECGGTP